VDQNKKKLFIITNENFYFDKKSYYCDNIDLKSIPEELSKYFYVNIIARKSNTQRSKLVKYFNIEISKNIFSFLLFVSNTFKYKNSEYLIISISPYTFLASIILKIFNK